MYTIQSWNTIITRGAEIMNTDGIFSYTKQCVISTPFLFKNPPDAVVPFQYIKMLMISIPVQLALQRIWQKNLLLPG